MPRQTQRIKKPPAGDYRLGGAQKAVNTTIPLIKGGQHVGHLPHSTQNQLVSNTL